MFSGQKLNFADFSDEENHSDGIDFENTLPKHFRNKFGIKKRSTVLDDVLRNENVTAALDESHVSQRGATKILGSIANAANLDIQNSSFSRSTIARKRAKARHSLAAKIRLEFMHKPKPDLLIHWDGKLMSNATDIKRVDEKIDRIAVAVTGLHESKILGVPKTTSGTGEMQARAVFDLITQYNLENNIIGMSFDTTSSNTGVHKGATILLEQLLGKKLLQVACRHHVFELVVETTFGLYFGPTNSPEVKIFNDFKKVWPDLEKSNISPLKDKRMDTAFAEKAKKEDVEFLGHVLVSPDKYCPRGDYFEVCELTLIVLGETPNESFKFKKPG